MAKKEIKEVRDKEETEDNEEEKDEDVDEDLELMVDNANVKMNRTNLEEIFPGLFERGVVNLERDLREIVVDNRNTTDNVDPYEIKNNTRNEDYFSAKDYSSIQDYSASATKSDSQTTFVQGNEPDFRMNRPPEIRDNPTQERTYSGKEKKRMW